MVTKRLTEPKKLKAKVFLVDDHAIVREGLKKIIDQQPDLSVCCESENATQAQAAIDSAHPDILVVDIALGGRDGLDLVKNVKELYPDLPMLVLSMHDENLFAERALRAGARGYIMKHEASDKVLQAIRSILAGDIYLSGRIKEKILGQVVGAQGQGSSSPLDRLSNRELEVFRFIGEGKTTRQIAEKLSLSPKTVETYRAQIMEKLRIETSAELVQRAFLWVHSKGVD